MTNPSLFSNPLQDYNDAKSDSGGDSGSQNFGGFFNANPTLDTAANYKIPNSLTETTPAQHFSLNVLEGRSKHNFNISSFAEDVDVDFEQQNSDPRVQDNFRFSFGAFWTTNENGKPKVYRKHLKSHPIEIENITQSQAPSGLFGREKHRITLKSDAQFPLKWMIKGEEQFDEKAIKGGVSYIDAAFSYNSPSIMNANNLQGKQSYWSRRNAYNFLHQDYEGAATVNILDEKNMPNIYSLIEQTTTDEFSDKVETHNTLSGALKSQFAKSRQDKTTLGLFANSRYLQDWAFNVGELTSDETKQVADSYQNIFFRAQDIKTDNYKKAANEYKELFPFFIRLKFTPTSDSIIAPFLSDIGFEKDLYQTFNSASYESKVVQTAESLQSDVIDNTSNIIFETKQEDIKFWNMNGWLKQLESGAMSLPDMELGSDTVHFKLDEEPQAPQAMKLIFNATFLDKIEKLRENKKRSFIDILNGKKAYSEILFYKVNKHRVVGEEQVEPEPTQTIIFPNISGKNLIKYVDTQVKYDQNYQYDVKAIHFVIGNSYSYIEPDQDDPKKGKFTAKLDRTEDGAGVNLVATEQLASFDVINEASYWLAEQTLFKTKKSKIKDNPPLYPDASFRRYKDNKNEMLLTLTKRVGSERELIKIIEENDREQFDDLRTSEKFETEGSLTKHEVFRLEEEPESYQDFTNGRKTTLKTKIDDLNKFKDKTSFKDKLEPNKTYYYTFRSRDFHDLLSNPSPIYVVEMRVDDGSIVPNIEIKTIGELRTNREKDVSMRQFLEIKPDFSQLLPDEGDSIVETAIDNKNKDVDIILGQRLKKVWGRDYKLRLTSKSSGKSVDINFKFTYTQKMPIQKIVDRINALPGDTSVGGKFTLDSGDYSKFEKYFGRTDI